MSAQGSHYSCPWSGGQYGFLSKDAAIKFGKATKTAAGAVKDGYKQAAPVVKDAVKNAYKQAAPVVKDAVKSSFAKIKQAFKEEEDLQEVYVDLDVLNEKKPSKGIKADGTIFKIRIVAGSNSNIRIINNCVAEVPILVEKVSEKDSLKKKLSNAGKSVAKGYSAFNNYASNIVV